MAISNTLTPTLSLSSLGGTIKPPSLSTQTSTPSTLPKTSTFGQNYINTYSSMFGGTPTTSSPTVSSPTTTTKGVLSPPQTSYSSTPTYTAPTNGIAAGTPAYDTKTGLLTDYGRYMGLPEVNAPKTTTTAPTSPTRSTTSTPQPSSTPTFSGLVGSAANQANNLNTQAGLINTTAGLIGSQGQVTPEEQLAKNRLAGLIGVQGAVNANIEEHPSEFAFQMGREAVAGRNIEAMRQALAAQSEAYATTRQANTQAYTGQANAQNAAGGLYNSAGGILNNAAGLVAPQAVPYNTQFLNPQTGQPINGGGAGTTGTALSQLPPQGQNFVQSLAQQVQNGSMTRGDAESRLNAYGVVGIQALNDVLGTSFNTNASNASAATTAQGQQLQTQASSAIQALDTLQAKFQSLNGLQTGGIPATNSIANWVASALGSSALTEYNQTLHDARQQLQGVLAAAGGGTPTGYESTAQTYLPDNMTPSQLTQAVANIKALIQQKVQSFTTSGQQTNTTQNASSNLFSW